MKRWLAAVSRSLINDFGHSAATVGLLLDQFRTELKKMNEEGTSSRIAARLMHAQTLLQDKVGAK